MIQAQIKPSPTNPQTSMCCIVNNGFPSNPIHSGFQYDTHCTSKLQQLWAQFKSAIGFGSCITLHLSEQQDEMSPDDDEPPGLTGTQVFWVSNEHRKGFEWYLKDIESSRRLSMGPVTITKTSSWADHFFDI